MCDFKSLVFFLRSSKKKDGETRGDQDRSSSGSPTGSRFWIQTWRSSGGSGRTSEAGICQTGSGSDGTGGGSSWFRVTSSVQEDCGTGCLAQRLPSRILFHSQVKIKQLPPPCSLQLFDEQQVRRGSNYPPPCLPLPLTSLC